MLQLKTKYIETCVNKIALLLFFEICKPNISFFSISVWLFKDFFVIYILYLYSVETALPNALCVQALWILLLSYHVDTLFVISV